MSRAGLRRFRAVARMPDPGRLLRGAQPVGGRPARGGAGRTEPRPSSFLSEQRVRRRLPGIGARHRLPVQLHLRRIDVRRHRTCRLGAGAGNRARGAIRQRLSPGRPRAQLSQHVDPPLLGAGPDPAGGGRGAHLLSPARQHGSIRSCRIPAPRSWSQRSADVSSGRASARARQGSAYAAPALRDPRSSKFPSSSARSASGPSARSRSAASCSGRTRAAASASASRRARLDRIRRPRRARSLSARHLA